MYYNISVQQTIRSKPEGGEMADGVAGLFKEHGVESRDVLLPTASTIGDVPKKGETRSTIGPDVVGPP